MEHIDCHACGAERNARPPNRAFMGLVAAFWAASIGLGFGAARGNGWGIILLSAWVVLAAAAVLFVKRATSWTCEECGSPVAPPTTTSTAPLTGSFRALHARHA